MKIRDGFLVFVATLGLSSSGAVRAQDVQKNVTYVCNGERLVIDSCNIRDVSDTSSCMVGHPDTILPNGLMKYTNETRGALKKLLPTCKQPSPEQVAKAKAFEKRQNDAYEANVKKANDENDAIEARAQQVIPGKKPQTPEERAITRCITSGRLPASCTGNALLGAFSSMITSVLPTGIVKDSTAAPAGPNMAGVFQGAGQWKLDFTADGVLVNCSPYLSPDERAYKIEFKNDRTELIVDVTPKPLVLTLKADGTIVGPGPFTIDGVVASGSSGGAPSGTSFAGGYKDRNGMSITDAQAATSSEVYDSMGNRTYSARNATQSQTVFVHKRVTCVAPVLSSKGAAVGMQTMQTDLLKTMFGGDKGAPTPPGMRMHGIFAAPTGFSAQFFPESVILGCGPDAARAYPYNVVAEGTKAVIHVGAPDHPLTLTFKPDGSLEPGATGPYQVHGRTVVGQNDDGDFTFAPMERTCDLAALTPAKSIPSGGGATTTTAATTGGGGANVPSNLSSAAAPLGNATLSIVSGFPAQTGVASPLAGRPYVLLRDSYANTLAKAGVSVPAGMSAYKYAGAACGNKTPDCQKITDAIKANAVSAIRADASGTGTLPGVPPGTYYLMISARYNNQSFVWGQAVVLKPGANSQTLDQRNATLLN